MSDYFFMLESRLSQGQKQAVVHVQQAAERAQMHLFLAGGALRDLLGGFPIRDLDFAVEGPAIKLARQLDPRLFTLLDADEDRQSAELLYGGEVTLEISMCRSETYTKTGGPPSIARATIQDDLRRRDFSVNAIALSLNPASRGLMIDPSNGLADITRKELRTLHNYSFFDDPARLLRLVRLEARLKYSIEERTQTQFHSAREAGVEEYISTRSRLIELRLLATEADGAGVAKALASAGLLGVFDPHLGKKLDPKALARLDKCRRLFEDSQLPVDPLGPFLYALTRKLSPGERANLRTSTGLHAAEARAWTELETRAKPLQKILTSKQAGQNSKLYRLLEAEDAAVLLFLHAFSPLAAVREKIKAYLTKLRPLARSLSDQDLDGLGVKPDSPKFARLREAYLTARLDNKIKSKAEAAKLLSGQR